MAVARARALGGDAAVLEEQHDEVIRRDLAEGAWIYLRERHYRWLITRRAPGVSP
jgi:hypothetical protein